jgi:carboxypeptidase C (cathepsin A)
LGGLKSVTRAAGVADVLQRRRIAVDGVILIGLALPLGQLTAEMRTALMLPTYTAAAFANKKLAPELQSDMQATLRQAEEWARNEYAAALTRRDSLSDSERQATLAQLARFTGLDASLIDRQTLIVARRQFAEQLLRDRKQELGRFDTRQIAGAESRPRPERNLVINKYLRSTLKFKTDLAYQGIEEGFSPNTGGRGLSVGARWDYNQGPPPPPGATPNTDSPPGGSQPWLRRAMAIDPSLKAFVAVGLYDSLNSCAGNDYLVSQLEPELKRNITARCYEGGHAMYESPGARRQLKQDIGKFIQDTVGGRPRPQGARP